MALTHLDARLGVVGRRRAHALLDLARHGQEGLLDVAGVLGRRFEEGNAQAVGELLFAPSASISHGKEVETWGMGKQASQVTWTRRKSYLRNGVLDHLLVGHIALVAYEQLVDALGGIPVNLLQPLLDVVEAVHVGNIVDDADAVSTPVVRRGDSSESFLTGGIPLFPSLVSFASSQRRGGLQSEA